MGYAAFKELVGEAIVASLQPLQERYREILADKTFLNALLKESRERACAIAFKTLRKVYKKIGFYRGE